MTHLLLSTTTTTNGGCTLRKVICGSHDYAPVLSILIRSELFNFLQPGQMQSSSWSAPARLISDEITLLLELDFKKHDQIVAVVTVVLCSSPVSTQHILDEELAYQSGDLNHPYFP